ncbi:MAG TPA: riboflavin synthase [Bacteroidia bacterium]|nr:riboflavin synthase [Bacteroidia bacterium]
MFTGIVEELGIVKDIAKEKGNLLITVEASFTSKLKLNESVSHNGVCLSVIPFTKKQYRVMAVQETLAKTNLKHLKKGDKINLERSMAANGQMDGHFVLGHVDGVMKCTSVKKLQGSHVFTFSCSKNDSNYIVSKGSVALNGVSLTIAKTSGTSFSVAIIPYTFSHTNFQSIKPGDEVNVEFDVLGKYVVQYLAKLKK